MSVSTRKKTALITGAGRGIGLAIARALAVEGYNLAIGDIQEEEAVAEALRGLEELGAEVLYCRADVADTASRGTMLAAVRERFGRLDVLVNNAGVAPKARADILEATEESFEWVMRVNLQGPYFLTQAVAKWMIEEKKAAPEFTGCIVNISSISAEVPSVNRGEYCISKAGVSMATRLWAARLAEFGINVYEVRPGLIMTSMTAPVKERYDALITGGALLQKRWGQPEDIAKAVAMLVRGDLGYSTGQVITVDGGFSLLRL